MSPSSPEPDELRRLVVPTDADGERLDRFLARLCGEVSRTRLQELVRAGAVRVDGAVADRPSRNLSADEVVEIELKSRVVAEEPSLEGLELSVVYEDEFFAIIDKPAGLLSHPGANTHGASVSALARRRWGDLPALQGADRPGIVHRLDVGTSGLMVIGREPTTFENLLQQFRERRVEKTYYAIVHGEPRFDTGWIEAPIGRSPSRPDRMSIVEGGGGRDASTYYQVLERFRGFGFLACRPKTGRTHQIRVHLDHIELPLVGDVLYRRRGPHVVKLAAEAPQLGRQALHAGRLALAHPKTGEPLAFESPLAPDLLALLEWLREHHPRV
ncbi:MAG: RluA family pseudouridine synthase [Planctomycetes bacterium]|nr:RluA family pseudouridine synthase [Planctomycetota bacterium]